MVEMMKKDTSYWWWFDSHQHSSKRSPWLQSVLGDLDMKTKTMLKLIEEDADSFAQRAEMYYKKRPELINMVEDFYKTHRSLAERYDLLKSESANRHRTTLGSPFSAETQQPKPMNQFNQTCDSHSETKIGYSIPTKDQQPKLLAEVDQVNQTYDSCSETGTQASGHPISTKFQQPKLLAGVDRFDQTYDSRSESETYDTEDSAESEVDDPETVLRNDMEEVQEPEADENEAVGLGLGPVSKDEVTKLQEEIERLKEENRIQKEQLLQKDEEKREVIRQLTSAVELLKEENDYLTKSASKYPPKKRSLFELEKLKNVFTGKLFSSWARSQGRVAAL